MEGGGVRDRTLVSRLEGHFLAPDEFIGPMSWTISSSPIEVPGRTAPGFLDVSPSG